MFNWMKQPVAATESINPENYSYEGDGHLMAFQEAFADLADINEIFANANAEGVNAYAEAWHNGGEQAATEAATAFASGAVMEGMLGDAWGRLKSAMQKLWEKIKAFFHSAIQYFDAFFKSAKDFAEKYEDEIKDKDLDKFKFRMFQWNFSEMSKISWDNVTQKAAEAAKKNGVVLEATGINAWADILLETFWTKGNQFSPRPLPGFTKDDGSWSKQDYFDNGYTMAAGGKGNTKVVDPAEPKGGNDSGEEKSSVAKISASQKKDIEMALINTLGGGSKSNIEAFRKELAKKLRGNATEAKEITPKIDEILSYLKDNEDLDNIKEWESGMNDSFKDIIDELNDKDAKNDEKIKIKNKVEVFTIGKNVAMAMFNVYTSAVKERHSQCKACLSAALHYSAPKN